MCSNVRARSVADSSDKDTGSRDTRTSSEKVIRRSSGRGTESSEVRRRSILRKKEGKLWAAKQLNKIAKVDFHLHHNNNWPETINWASAFPCWYDVRTQGPVVRRSQGVVTGTRRVVKQAGAPFCERKERKTRYEWRNRNSYTNKNRNQLPS